MSGEKKLKMKEPALVSCETSAVTLMWTKVEGASGYKLRFRPIDENEWTNIEATVTSTQIKKKNLQAGKGVIFMVRPVFGAEAGEGEWGWSSSSAAMVPNDETPNIWQPFYLMRQLGNKEADEPRCLAFSDILSEDGNNKIDRIVLFTKDVACKTEADVEDWLGQRWGTNQKKVAVDIFCDAKSKHIPKTGDSLGRYNRLTITPVLNLEAGGHHTRLAIVFYNTGVRIAVMSCDLDSEQMSAMTHAVFVQDFPPKPEHGNRDPSPFEYDLYEYISHVQPALHPNHTRNKDAENSLSIICEHLRKFDYHNMEAVLMPTVPGKHLVEGQEGSMAPSMENLGHAKLHRLLGAEVNRPASLKIGSGNNKALRSLYIDIQPPGIQALSKGEAYLTELASTMRNDKTKRTDLGGGNDDDGTPKKKKAKKGEDDDGKALENIDDVRVIWPDCGTVGRASGGYTTGEWIPAAAKHLRVDDKSSHFKPMVSQCLRKWDGAPGNKAKHAPHLSVRPFTISLRLLFFSFSVLTSTLPLTPSPPPPSLPPSP